MSKKLTIKTKKIVAKTIAHQVLNSIDSFAFEDSGLNEEEIQSILDEIYNLSSRFKTEFSHIGNVVEILEESKK